MTTDELKKLIAKRNAAIRKDHERRYGKPLPEEPEAARFRRIMGTPSCWTPIGG